MTHAFNPNHLQVFAKYLLIQEFSDKKYDLQCIYRTIVNRAYLSTYLQTSEWILNNGEHNNVKDYAKGDIGYHAAILVALKALKKFVVHEKYSEFLDLRVEADYNIVNIITLDDAKRAIELADEITNALH